MSEILSITFMLVAVIFSLATKKMADRIDALEQRLQMTDSAFEEARIRYHMVSEVKHEIDDLRHKVTDNRKDIRIMLQDRPAPITKGNGKKAKGRTLFI